MNEMITEILLFGIFLLLILSIDVVSAQNTALKKILQNPGIGGFMLTNILYLVLIGIGVHKIVILSKPIEVKDVELFIFVIGHLFLIKILPKYYYKKYSKQYEGDKYAFLTKYKKYLCCSFEQALKDHGIESK